MAKQANKPLPKEAIVEALWRKGNLSWLLDKNQKELYDLFYTGKHRVMTWLLSRRSGKSFALCVLAIETCLKKPNSIVKFLAPTRVQVNLIIRPLMQKLLETCPEDLKPEHKLQDNIYYFSNGSEIQLSGSDGGAAERLRGGDADLVVVDEAGSCSELGYCVKDILLPTTLITKGKIILASTPPKDTDHDFIQFIEKAEAEGSIVVKTIDDNPRVDQSEKDNLIKELGGPNSDSTKRELYCKIVKSAKGSVIPEFDDDKAKELVREWEHPPYSDRYVSMDVGLKDWTVVLFGYYDFRHDKIIIQDELAAYGPEMHLPKLTLDIKHKEEALWTNKLTNEFIKPKKRISDHNLIVINEIKKFSGYTINFDLAKKGEKLAGINWLRTLINGNKVIIDPKCQMLIRHLKNARWATQNDRDVFARGADDSHYDAVDALVYLVNNIDFKNNPYPKDFQSPLRRDDAFYTPQYEDKKTANVNVYKKILNLKGKR